MYGDPDEEYSLMEWEYEHRYDPPATESEAHAEWHRNSGVPMGTPGCPWDACDGPSEWEIEAYEWERSLRGRLTLAWRALRDRFRGRDFRPPPDPDDIPF